MASHSVDQLAIIAQRNYRFYSPLQSPTSIRLLRLEPSSDEAESIKCALIVVIELQKARDFEALSYCWGAGGRSQEVFCDNETAPFIVSENLFYALKRLRLGDRARTLWIDAMCINQHDLLERGQQVSIMRMIYSQSSGVVVWLGELDGTFAAAIKFMQEMAQDILRQGRENGSNESCVHALRTMTVQDKLRHLKSWSLPPNFRSLMETCWEGLARFYELPWFYRVWVVQEIQSCETAQVLCGEYSIDWILVDFIARWFVASKLGNSILQRLKLQENDNQGAFMGTEQLHFMRVKHLNTPQEVPFLRLLDRAQSFRSSNPRDKIFALLTHPASSKHPPGIESRPEDQSWNEITRTSAPTRHLDVAVDYTIPLVELLRQVTLRSITQYNTLETLNYAWKVRRELFSVHDHLSDHSPPAASEGYPSWVPQWDAVIGNRRSHFRGYLYDASLGQTPQLQFDEAFPDRIFLRGIVVDLVKETNVVFSTLDSFQRRFHNGMKSRMFQHDDLNNLSLLLAQDDSHHRNGVRLDSEGIHQRASENVDEHFANFAAYVMKLLDGEKKSKYLSSFFVTCHVCYKSLTAMQAYEEVQKAWNCRICHMGAFDICEECYGSGKRCLDEGHEIRKRNLQGFWFEFEEGVWERLSKAALLGKAEEFQTAVAQAADRRAPFTTERGMLGICPLLVVPGDVVVVMFGGRNPFVLRKVEGYYKLIAECYTHGIMDGEVVEMWKAGDVQTELFELR